MIKEVNNIKDVVYVVWRLIVIPVLYIFSMWLSLVAGVTLIFGDPIRAAGIVSSFTLFYIIQSEFYKEFLGNRHGIQEQKKR